MKKVTKPYPPDLKSFIITEGINYFDTKSKSIWGAEDTSTKDIIKKYVKPKTSWINLAAGDGRYNTIIARIADKVTAVDIDASALSKLWFTTPKEYQKKIELKTLDITKDLPFPDKLFDGVFSAGTLYLFPIYVLKNITQEVHRIIKDEGYFISEFAFDIKRVDKNGKLLDFGDEPQYSEELAKNTIKNISKGLKVKFYEGEEINEICDESNPPYKFYCKTFIAVTHKV